MRALRRADGARVTAALAALVAVLAMHGPAVQHHPPAPLVGAHAGAHAAPPLVLGHLTAADDAHADDCGDCGTGAHAALLLCVAVLTAAGAVLVLSLAARSRRTTTHGGPPQPRRPPPSRRPRPPDLLSELCISRT